MLDKVAKTHGKGVVCINANQQWQQQQPHLKHMIKMVGMAWWVSLENKFELRNGNLKKSVCVASNFLVANLVACIVSMKFWTLHWFDIQKLNKSLWFENKQNSQQQQTWQLGNCILKQTCVL